jgi:hypothetical protein
MTAVPHLDQRLLGGREAGVTIGWIGSGHRRILPGAPSTTTTD